jgi:hypothetical protein
MAMSRYNTIGENYLEMERKKLRVTDVAACLCILMILGVGFCFAFFTGVRGSDLQSCRYGAVGILSVPGADPGGVQLAFA